MPGFLGSAFGVFIPIWLIWTFVLFHLTRKGVVVSASNGAPVSVPTNQRTDATHPGTFRDSLGIFPLLVSQGFIWFVLLVSAVMSCDSGCSQIPSALFFC